MKPNGKRKWAFLSCLMQFTKHNIGKLHSSLKGRYVKILISFIFPLFILVSLIHFSLFLDKHGIRSISSLIKDRKIFYQLCPSDISNNLNETSHENQNLILRKSEIGKQSYVTEALSSLNVAVQMKKAGKLDKAMKLMEHSFQLAPKHPDVLNNYGEFLEDIMKDVVTADQMYFQVLVKYPDHKYALENRQRTSGVVDELDRIILRAIDEKRNKVAAIPENNPILCRTKKEVYFQHIYHTAGIEGNTMTLSQTRSIVETRMAIGGKSIQEHNEILGIDSALRYVNTTLINRIGRITVEDILEIHKRVLGFVDPTSSGIFRKSQVFVGSHIPPAPGLIKNLMDEFAEWMNSDIIERLHPVQLSALVHYKLVHIHPFVDGNGRTARLLMNMVLMQAGFPPVIIPKQDRHTYYKTLEIANNGDIRPFMRFIAKCTEKTLDIFIWTSIDNYTNDHPAIESDNVIISNDWA